MKQKRTGMIKKMTKKLKQNENRKINKKQEMQNKGIEERTASHLKSK